ncbi:hypothetical protein [Streptomyces sp. NEAU-H3]|uniref:hypothetical protein n=1 Tax=Streptomyces sp. NEAU-H3 TaxID=2720636 RepID=UPI001438DE33|nr:hypothetical protein [Streptomyces sp. NEAU-H3]NJA56664.1 hypothetical protein [Streptomyces sp. NEAU-H3]
MAGRSESGPGHVPDINTWPCRCGTHNPDWATHCTTCGRPWTHSTDKENPQ